MKVKKAYRKVCIYHRPFHTNLASAPYQDSHCQEVCCKKSYSFFASETSQLVIQKILL